MLGSIVFGVIALLGDDEESSLATTDLTAPSAPVTSGEADQQPPSDAHTDAIEGSDDPVTETPAATTTVLEPDDTADSDDDAAAGDAADDDAGATGDDAAGDDAGAADAADDDAAAAGDDAAEDDAADAADDDAAGDASGGDDGDAADGEEPPESKAVVRGGQIFLEGAVPSAEAGDEIEALAAEILGADNVFNNYVVDPLAGDPNLGNITVEDTINFETDSAVILAEGEGLLNQGLALLTLRPAMTITIVGHTDARGSTEGNQVLSEQRAEAVRQWFVERGIDGDRLTAIGAGEAEPIADNDTVEGRRLNRRIQFFLENILGDA